MHNFVALILLCTNMMQPIFVFINVGSFLSGLERISRLTHEHIHVLSVRRPCGSFAEWRTWSPWPITRSWSQRKCSHTCMASNTELGSISYCQITFVSCQSIYCGKFESGSFNLFRTFWDSKLLFSNIYGMIYKWSIEFIRTYFGWFISGENKTICKIQENCWRKKCLHFVFQIHTLVDLSRYNNPSQTVIRNLYFPFPFRLRLYN